MKLGDSGHPMIMLLLRTKLFLDFILDRLEELCSQVLDEDRRLLGAVDYYFIEEDGARCKTGNHIHNHNHNLAV